MIRLTLLCVSVAALASCVDDTEPTTDEAISVLQQVAASSATDLGDEASSMLGSVGNTVPECPGVVLGGTDRYDGLVGYYSRLYPHVAGELATLRIATLEQNPEWIGVRGDYSALVQRGGIYAAERGRYVAVPNNPAIGPAIGLDAGVDDTIDELYWVLGLTRNLFGKVDKLCLAGSRSDGSGRPFLLLRLGW